jgi:hypothetical protein
LNLGIGLNYRLWMQYWAQHTILPIRVSVVCEGL